MTEKTVLIIDDEKNIWETIKTAVETAIEKVVMKAKAECHEDLEILNEINEDSSEVYALIVLDLKLSDLSDSTSRTIDRLRKISEEYFIPCVIYSAHDQEISDEQRKGWHFIRVVPKSSSGGENLDDAIYELLKYKSSLFNLEKDIIKQFRSLSIVTMDEIFRGEGSVEERTVHAMMISRLIGFLTRNMDNITGKGVIPAEAKIIYPPIQVDDNIQISMGDVLKSPDCRLWLIMSPSCDMVNHSANTKESRGIKIKNVLLMPCFTSACDSKKYAKDVCLKFQSDNERTVVIKVPISVSNSGILGIHTKMYETREYNEIKVWKKVLSLASPYAEDIKATFMRDIIRLGVPETVPKNDALIKKFNGGS